MSHDRLEVILDLSPLGEAEDNRAGARGIHRVTGHLFQGLLEADCYNLRYVSTTNLAGTSQFLNERGLHPEKTLGYRPGQLRRSQIGRKAAQWVHGHMTISGLAGRASRRAMATVAALGAAGDGNFPVEVLEGADLYHSPLRPIPKSVREHRKLRHFLTIHDLLPLTHPEALKPGSDVFTKKLLASLSPASFVFCVSEHVKSEVLRVTQLDAGQVFVTPLAADRSIFFPVTDPDVIQQARKAYGIPDRPYFLTLSSFDPRKNFGHIIRCFSELLEAGKLGNELLVIVGSNPERNRFVEEALSRNPLIRNHIVMPGYVPDHDLAAIYTGALAFLFPSLGEGFGLPVLEAMQCGTPVLSSDSTSLPEVLGDAGILLAPTDRDAWCQAMLDLAHDSSLRETLRAKGLARSTLFTWEKFIEATRHGYACATRSS